MATTLRLAESERIAVRPQTIPKVVPADRRLRLPQTRTKPGYSLTTALLIVRKMETQPMRNAVFSEIKDKNFLYRLVDRAYALSGYMFLQPLVLFAYMLKCVASIGPDIDKSAKLISIENFRNEAHSIERVLGLMPDISPARLTLKRKHCFRATQINALLSMIFALPRLWRFIHRLSRTHGFMPACRIASVLAYYIRFNEILKTHPHLKTALVASNYSPECVGLAAAAHANGRKTIYANHAPVPANTAFMPPVLADYAVFYGDAIRKAYEKRSRCKAQVINIGQPGKTRTIRWKPGAQTVGIFLTALTHPEALEALVRDIKKDCPDVSILIRHHPVSLLETDVSNLTSEFPDIRTTLGTDLNEDIADCDLVFCGNSGVVMNVLRGGRPVAYLSKLDRLPHDYNGFVASGLAFEADGWHANFYDQLRWFYDEDKWQETMRDYDASYGIPEEYLQQNARKKLAEWIR